MKKKRKNPYNVEDVMERDNLTREEALKTIQELKDRTSGSLKSFQKRYGEVEGKIRYDEFCAKSAITKEKYQEKYGDIWEEKWIDYLKAKDSMSLEFHINKYGKELGLQKYQERLNAVKQSLEKMIERYGEEDGTKRFNDMNEKRSYSCSTEGLIEKYGEERTKLINKSKSLPGELNGMYGIPPPPGAGNGWSGWYKGLHFRSLLELSYMVYLDEKNINYATAETKDYEVVYEYNSSKKTYRPDFIVDDKIVEIKPLNLINTEINKIKFKEAQKLFGSKFEVLTEKDFPQINDISSLIESGVVKLMERYERKYNENYKNN